MDEELDLPCDQAMIAATLALMTAYADPAPDAKLPVEGQRRQMARKIVSNLFFLREHPAVGAGMRQVLTRMHRQWVALAEGRPAIWVPAGAPPAAGDDPTPPPERLH
jgi:hypothetical protein